MVNWRVFWGAALSRPHPEFEGWWRVFDSYKGWWWQCCRCKAYSRGRFGSKGRAMRSVRAHMWWSHTDA